MKGTRVPQGTRGFTLIELLIVVAIIAILAAIAVPNFLEAQTRSKVSRALADLRSLATALEAYRVDFNRYTPDPIFYNSVWNGGGSRWPGGGTMSQTQVDNYLALQRLTTPVAYLTSVPEMSSATTHLPATTSASRRKSGMCTGDRSGGNCRWRSTRDSRCGATTEPCGR